MDSSCSWSRSRVLQSEAQQVFKQMLFSAESYWTANCTMPSSTSPVLFHYRLSEPLFYRCRLHRFHRLKHYQQTMKNQNLQTYCLLIQSIVFSIIFKNFRMREKFINFMKKNGIFCYFHYFPLHMSSFGKKFQKTKMTNTEKIYNGLVRLPLYPGLKISEQKKVIVEAKKFLKLN